MAGIKIFAKIFIIVFISVLFTGCTPKKAPSCDSSYTEKEVIAIYRDQVYKDSGIYKNIHEAYPNISIALLYPQATDYNADIDKYFCKGIIHIFNPSGDLTNLDYSDSQQYYVNGYKDYITYEISHSKKDIYFAITSYKHFDIEYGKERAEYAQWLERIRIEDMKRKEEENKRQRELEEQRKYQEVQELF